MRRLRVHPRGCERDECGSEGKGLHLEQDPWSIPADLNFDIFERLTPKDEALTAKLRRERLARREADKRAAEQVEEMRSEADVRSIEGGRDHA